MVLYIWNDFKNDGKLTYTFKPSSKLKYKQLMMADRSMLFKSNVIISSDDTGFRILKSRYQDDKGTVSSRGIIVPFPDQELVSYSKPLTPKMLEALFWIGEEGAYDFMRHISKNYNDIVTAL
ncbi:hypothetical protein NVP2275O_258 [Vibrio phage 2.275.O._10N.286.54.E11]|nr:hypothetical protein NVP2275O_258 [Vibrio phage 2.275.O._10N.286.54.E11]